MYTRAFEQSLHKRFCKVENWCRHRMLSVLKAKCLYRRKCLSVWSDPGSTRVLCQDRLLASHSCSQLGCHTGHLLCSILDNILYRLVFLFGCPLYMILNITIRWGILLGGHIHHEKKKVFCSIIIDLFHCNKEFSYKRTLWHLSKILQNLYRDTGLGLARCCFEDLWAIAWYYLQWLSLLIVSIVVFMSYHYWSLSWDLLQVADFVGRRKLNSRMKRT